MKTLTLAFFIFLISPFSFANTQFAVDNHTKAYGTAQTGMSPCSSSAGNTGLIKPHGVYKVPEDAFNMFCKTTCQIKLYMNKNCSHKPIGIIKVNHTKGILKIDDYHVNQYALSGSGFLLAVEGGPKKNIG